jgi:Protein of unknown function (DUF2939)
MSRNTILAFAGVAIVMLLAWYFVSPFFALSSIATAVKSGDRDRLSIAVDFPSVRAGLKEQLDAFILKRANADPSMRNNPFAGLAMMLAPVMVDRIIDGYVTPDGFAALLSRRLSGEGADSPSHVLMRRDFSYIDADHFRATFRNAQHPNESISLMLERRGIFSWKLMRVDLPLEDIANDAHSADENSPSETSGAPDADAQRPPPPEVGASQPPDVPNEALPTGVGQCAQTTVVKVETRLMNEDGTNVPGTGSSIEYKNGGHQVSYDQIPGIDHSQVGDSVTLCLVSIPKDCPPGDDRGRVYHAKNLRTDEEWEEADSEHACGGA